MCGLCPDVGHRPATPVTERQSYPCVVPWCALVAQERTILLYFRGFSADGQPLFGRGGYEWSFGVRQEMFRRYRGRYKETGILLDTMENEPADSWHLRQMMRSLFCLAPRGGDGACARRRQSSWGASLWSSRYVCSHSHTSACTPLLLVACIPASNWP